MLKSVIARKRLGEAYYGLASMDGKGRGGGGEKRTPVKQFIIFSS